MDKFFGLVTLMSVCAIAAAYTDIDETLVVEDLIKNKTALIQYMDCFLDRAPCTPQTAAYKSKFFEVIDDGCRECDNTGRHMFRVFIAGIKKMLPDDYQKFRDKYDLHKHFDHTMVMVQKY